MAYQPLVNEDKVRAELELDPGISILSIAKKLNMPTTSVMRMLNRIDESNEFGDKTLMAKRDAYKNGGTQVVKLIKKQPGASYQAIHKGLSMNKKGRQASRIGDLDTILKKLIAYCKTYKDEELRGTLLKHKKENGYWPK